MRELTAVEWLVKQINDGQFITDKLLEKAKEMEKQQIIDAHEYGFYSPAFRMSRKAEAEQYYNETFNK